MARIRYLCLVEVKAVIGADTLVEVAASLRPTTVKKGSFALAGLAVGHLGLTEYSLEFQGRA